MNVEATLAKVLTILGDTQKMIAQVEKISTA
jgi:hypothetical protein